LKLTPETTLHSDKFDLVDFTDFADLVDFGVSHFDFADLVDFEVSDLAVLLDLNRRAFFGDFRFFFSVPPKSGWPNSLDILLSNFARFAAVKWTSL